MRNEAMQLPEHKYVTRKVRRAIARAVLIPLTWLIALSSALLFMMQSGAAHAEDTVGNLSKIQSETMLLKAKRDKASVQAELDKSGAAGVAATGDEPVVRNVYGVGGQMAASFLYSSGVTVEGKVGDTIIGGYKVVTITIDKVELSKGGKVFPVGFSATPPVQSKPGSPGTNASPGMPGFPTVVR